MTTPVYAAVPAGFRTPKPVGFNTTNGTIAKVILDAYAAAAAASPQPLFSGGCTLLDLIATSSDASARDIELFTGTILTTQDAVLTGNITTTTTTVVRATGSFITDGWEVGDVVSIYAPDGTAAVAGVDGLFGAISAVTATTLTFTAINGAWSAATAATGSRVVAVGRMFRVTIPINAGNANNVPSVSLLNNAMDASVSRFERKLDSSTLLIAKMVAALSAIPATITLTPVIARY